MIAAYRQVFVSSLWIHLRENDTFSRRRGHARILGKEIATRSVVSFFERKRAGRFHLTRNEEDVGRRIWTCLPARSSRSQRNRSKDAIEIGLLQVVYRLGIFLAGGILCMIKAVEP